jgi:hypothetical protein
MACPVGDFARCDLGVFDSEIADHHIRALLGEHGGDGATYAARSAGYENGFVFKVDEVHDDSSMIRSA